MIYLDEPEFIEPKIEIKSDFESKFLFKIYKNFIFFVQIQSGNFSMITLRPEAEFKEFEPRLKYGWFPLKLYSMFQDSSRRSIETGFWRTLDAAQIH